MPNILAKAYVENNAVELLMQVDRSSLVKGGWVSSDSWFSSIASYIKFKEWLNVHSTFVVKFYNVFP